MLTNIRDTAVYKAHSALEQFAQRNITLPDSVTDQVEVLERIRSTAPQRPATTALRERILAGASQNDINAVLLRDLGFARLQVEHNQAKIEAALNVLRAIRDAHDDLHEQLKRLADKRIQHLGAVAELDTTNIMHLVRAGDHQGAQLVVELDVTAAELDAVYAIRDNYLAAGGPQAMRLGPVDASRWRDPETPGRGNSIAEQFLDGLRRGNTLWYPTKSEAIEAAGPAYEKEQRKAERDVQVRRRQHRDSTAFAV